MTKKDAVPIKARDFVENSRFFKPIKSQNFAKVWNICKVESRIIWMNQQKYLVYSLSDKKYKQTEELNVYKIN